MDLTSLDLETLIVNPNTALNSYSVNPGKFAEDLFDHLGVIPGKVLRLILYQLYLQGVSLEKLEKQRTSPDLPEWYFAPDRIPVENLLIAIRYGLPLAWDGNLILWNQLGRPFNDLVLDSIGKRVDLNMINESEGLTLLQKAIQIGSLDNVRSLLRHRVQPDVETVKMATGLQIIRELKIYGGQFPKSTDPKINRYLEMASQFKPSYYVPSSRTSELDRQEDLTTILTVYPSLVRSSEVQSQLSGVDLNSLDKSLKDKSKQVIQTGYGILKWPFYMNSIGPIQVCPLKPEMRFAKPPSSDRIYELALAEFPDLEPELEVFGEDNPVPVPTEYYPEVLETFSLPG